MNYEQALRAWGKAKLEESERRYAPAIEVDPETVNVGLDFNAGYACCGGRDPDCYCSFAESPSAKVSITGHDKNSGAYYSHDIEAYDFDFAAVLKEIVDAGGGVIDS
ncbi:hypothetical protein ACFWDN_13035 [Micromonospora chalcea]